MIDMNPTNATITCDICGEEFHLNKSLIKEDHTVLHKGDQDYPVIMTYLQCPHCSKQYIVIIDDDDSYGVLQETHAALMKRMKYLQKGYTVPHKLEKSYQNLTSKLDFKRRQLAEKFNGALYQFEGDTIQRGGR